MNIADGLNHMAIRGVHSGEIVARVLIRCLYQDVVSVCSVHYCHARFWRGAFPVGVFTHIELQLNANLYHL